MRPPPSWEVAAVVIAVAVIAAYGVVCAAIGALIYALAVG